MATIILFTKDGLTKNLIRLGLGEKDVKFKHYDEETYSQAKISPEAICIFDDSLFSDPASVGEFLSRQNAKNQSLFLTKELLSSKEHEQVIVIKKPFEPRDLQKYF